MKFFFTSSNVNIQSSCIESINKRVGMLFKENFINPSIDRVSGTTIPTEWHFLSSEQTSTFSYNNRFTFTKNTCLTSVNEFQKIPDDNQRISLLQQLNQALDKETDEFVKVIRSLQVQKEPLKKNQMQTNRFGFLKIFTKFFSVNKQSYENGSKKCNDEFMFDHFKIKHVHHLN